jgi:ubiquinol-cytochrome c reductase cytochrome c subunit
MNKVKRFSIFAAVALACATVSGAAFAASADNGKKAFVKNGCWQCHGFQGQGSIMTSNGKVLADTELPFETFEAFVRSTNLAMPPYSEAILSSSDLADIYAFLQSIPKPKDVGSIQLLK